VVDGGVYVVDDDNVGVVDGVCSVMADVNRAHDGATS
jgi:hypothetical protein